MGRSSANPALLSFDEASALISAHAARLARTRVSTERVALLKALGRVLAEPLRADSDQPAFARSSRDGFACRAAEAATHRSLIVAGSARAGDAPSGPLPRDAVWEIMTGAPVPTGADAVIMLEHIETGCSGTSQTIRLLPPRTVENGENIVARGAQARKGEELHSMGTAIGAAQVALAGFCGCSTLKVFARPRVAILATGDELVRIAQKPAPGQIRNSSSAMLSALVSQAGGAPWILPTARDNAMSLDAALARAVSADLLLITGGVSAGKFDLVEPALARAGARFHFTGVRIQPGKPLVFAELRRRPAGTVQNQNRTKCYVFGLPGNPVSSAVTFLVFGAPLLAALAGRSASGPSLAHGPRFALARLAQEVKVKPGLTRFLPAACTFASPLPEVARVPWEGSGDLAAMARANCYLVVPDDASRLRKGDTVRILLI